MLSRNNTNLKFVHNSFRKKQRASIGDIEILKQDIESKCSDRISILNILDLTIDKQFRPRKLSLNDDVEINAKKIRLALGISTNGPIYSVSNVLEHAGIIVLSFECAEDIDGINGTVNGIPYIFFNSNRTIERQRFTMIHEVCHLFFNEPQGEICEKEFEKYINKLAGNVLIPTDDIYSIFGKTNRSITFYLRDQVAKEYKIAVSCLITRLFEAGVVTEMYMKKYFMILNKNGGKKAEKSLLDIYRDSEQPTLFNPQVYLALSEELISTSRAAEYLHVPLYEVVQNMRTI